MTCHQSINRVDLGSAHRKAVVMNRALKALNVTFSLGAYLDYLFRTSLALYITYHYQDQQWLGLNSDQIVVLTMSVLVAPYLIVSGLAGKISDKFIQNRILHRVKAFEILVMCLAVCGFYFQSVGLLLLTLFLMGTQSTFMVPVAYDLIPKLVQHAESQKKTEHVYAKVVEANSVIGTCYIVAIALGTLSAGCIMTWFGMPTLYLCLVGLACAGFASTFLIPALKANDPELKLSWHPVRDNVELMRFVKRDGYVFQIIIASSFVWLIHSTLMSLLPVYSAKSLMAGLPITNVLYMIVSLGSGVGSILAQRYKHDVTRPVRVCVGVMSVSLLALAAIGNVLGQEQSIESLGQFFGYTSAWLIMLGFIGFAVSVGVLNIMLEVLIQMRTEETYRSRVIAGWSALCSFAMVLSSVFVSVLLGYHFSAIQILYGLSALNFMAFLVILRDE